MTIKILRESYCTILRKRYVAFSIAIVLTSIIAYRAFNVWYHFQRITLHNFRLEEIRLITIDGSQELGDPPYGLDAKINFENSKCPLNFDILGLNIIVCTEKSMLLDQSIFSSKQTGGTFISIGVDDLNFVKRTKFAFNARMKIKSFLFDRTVEELINSKYFIKITVNIRARFCYVPFWFTKNIHANKLQSTTKANSNPSFDSLDSFRLHELLSIRIFNKYPVSCLQIGLRKKFKGDFNLDVGCLKLVFNGLAKIIVFVTSFSSNNFLTKEESMKQYDDDIKNNGTVAFQENIPGELDEDGVTFYFITIPLFQNLSIVKFMKMFNKGVSDAGKVLSLESVSVLSCYKLTGITPPMREFMKIEQLKYQNALKKEKLQRDSKEKTTEDKKNTTPLDTGEFSNLYVHSIDYNYWKRLYDQENIESEAQGNEGLIVNDEISNKQVNSSNRLIHSTDSKEPYPLKMKSGPNETFSDDQLYIKLFNSPKLMKLLKSKYHLVKIINKEESLPSQTLDFFHLRDSVVKIFQKPNGFVNFKNFGFVEIPSFSRVPILNYKRKINSNTGKHTTPVKRSVIHIQNIEFKKDECSFVIGFSSESKFLMLLLKLCKIKTFTELVSKLSFSFDIFLGQKKHWATGLVEFIEKSFVNVTKEDEEAIPKFENQYESSSYESITRSDEESNETSSEDLHNDLNRLGSKFKEDASANKNAEDKGTNEPFSTRNRKCNLHTNDNILINEVANRKSLMKKSTKLQNRNYSKKSKSMTSPPGKESDATSVRNLIKFTLKKHSSHIFTSSNISKLNISFFKLLHSGKVFADLDLFHMAFDLPRSIYIFDNFGNHATIYKFGTNPSAFFSILFTHLFSEVPNQDFVKVESNADLLRVGLPLNTTTSLKFPLEFPYFAIDLPKIPFTATNSLFKIRSEIQESSIKISRASPPGTSMFDGIINILSYIMFKNKWSTPKSFLYMIMKGRTRFSLHEDFFIFEFAPDDFVDKSKQNNDEKNITNETEQTPNDPFFRIIPLTIEIDTNNPEFTSLLTPCARISHVLMGNDSFEPYSLCTTPSFQKLHKIFNKPIEKAVKLKSFTFHIRNILTSNDIGFPIDLNSCTCAYLASKTLSFVIDVTSSGGCGYFEKPLEAKVVLPSINETCKSFTERAYRECKLHHIVKFVESLALDIIKNDILDNSQQKTDNNEDIDIDKKDIAEQEAKKVKDVSNSSFKNIIELIPDIKINLNSEKADTIDGFIYFKIPKVYFGRIPGVFIDPVINFSLATANEKEFKVLLDIKKDEENIFISIQFSLTKFIRRDVSLFTKVNNQTISSTPVYLKAFSNLNEEQNTSAAASTTPNSSQLIDGSGLDASRITKLPEDAHKANSNNSSQEFYELKNFLLCYIKFFISASQSPPKLPKSINYTDPMLISTFSPNKKQLPVEFYFDFDNTTFHNFEKIRPKTICLHTCERQSLKVKIDKIFGDATSFGFNFSLEIKALFDDLGFALGNLLSNVPIIEVPDYFTLSLNLNNLLAIDAIENYTTPSSILCTLQMLSLTSFTKLKIPLKRDKASLLKMLDDKPPTLLRSQSFNSKISGGNRKQTTLINYSDENLYFEPAIQEDEKGKGATVGKATSNKPNQKNILKQVEFINKDYLLEIKMRMSSDRILTFTEKLYHGYSGLKFRYSFPLNILMEIFDELKGSQSKGVGGDSQLFRLRVSIDYLPCVYLDLKCPYIINFVGDELMSFFDFGEITRIVLRFKGEMFDSTVANDGFLLTIPIFLLHYSDPIVEKNPPTFLARNESTESPILRCFWIHKDVKLFYNFLLVISSDLKTKKILSLIASFTRLKVGSSMLLFFISRTIKIVVTSIQKYVAARPYVYYSHLPVSQELCKQFTVLTEQEMMEIVECLQNSPKLPNALK